MAKNIYVLLNNVETDLDEYDSGEMEAGEAKRRAEEIIGKLHRGEREEIAAGKEKNVRNVRGKKFIKAAAVFMLALLSAGGVVYAATDGEIFQEIFEMISGGMISETTTYYTDGSKDVIVQGTSTVQMSGEDNGFPLLLEDGRLYFTGAGGKTDVTDEISETEPYYIDVIDAAGNTHRFVIGGRAEAGYYGYHEMLFDKNGEFRGGTGSFGENVPKDGTLGPVWYEKAWEEVMKTIHP